jgi:hypothetical protein
MLTRRPGISLRRLTHVVTTVIVASLTGIWQFVKGVWAGVCQTGLVPNSDVS